jgi:hypothetical protein
MERSERGPAHIQGAANAHLSPGVPARDSAGGDDHLSPLREEEENTAQHMLKFCPAWAESRRVLQLDIGESLAPAAVIEALLRGPLEFNAVRSYCERVMLVPSRASDACSFASEKRDRERARDPSRSSR